MKKNLLLFIISVTTLITAKSQYYDIHLINVNETIIRDSLKSIRNHGGGTLYIPTCDVVLGHTSFKVAAGVKVIGNGMDSSILRNCIFSFNGQYFGNVGDSICRLSSLSIINDNTVKHYQYVEANRLKGFRMDHCYIEGTPSTLSSLSNNGWVVIDHCSFELVTSYGFYCHADNSWQQNIGSNNARNLLGKANKQTVFVEDCHFEGFYDHLMDGRTGAHYVFRHNTIEYNEGSGPLEGHGPTTPGSNEFNEGTNAIEIYDVTINQNGYSGSAGILIRSGVAAIHNVTIKDKRYGVALAVENSPYNYSRTAGDYPVYNQPHGVWIWDMTYNNIKTSEILITWNSDACIKENRDYFLRAPNQTDDGFTYTTYPYPHPVVSGNQPTVAISEKENLDLNVNIYPNPFKDLINIEFCTINQGKVKIAVCDFMGRKIQIIENKNYPTGKHTITFNGAAFSKGIYFINIYSEGQSISKKLIKL